MNRPDITLDQKIGQCIDSGISFALYRMPWSETPLMAMGQGQGYETLQSLRELNGKKGFLISPFKTKGSHSIVLINAERVWSGWEEIDKGLSTCTIGSADNENTTDTTDGAEKDESLQKAAYETVFEKFITELRQQHFSKLVLSRSAACPIDGPFHPLTAFVTACNAYPRMMISLVYTPVTGMWIGTSPEIILRGGQHEWNTVALAGTMPMCNGELPTSWSDKNREEQAYVADYIRNIIVRYGTGIAEKGPFTARAGQLAHLKTEFAFRLKDDSLMGNLIEELHPTPAVCGLPKTEAYHFINENEGYDRAYYSGIIGWTDPKGETALYVNLRCMHVALTTATLYAGGGILASSDKESEWNETLHKMNTIRTCLNAQE